MGLHVSIYRDDYDSDHNVFYGKRRLTITNVEGPFEPTDDAPAALLTKHAGNFIVIPDDGYTDDAGPQMNGGTYASTSDSRWRRAIGIYAAIPIHDRRETWAEYERYSR